MEISIWRIVVFSLYLLIPIVSAADTQAKPAPDGKVHHQKASVILRDYSNRNRLITEEDRQQLQEALAHLNRALELEPQNVFYWYSKGEALQLLDRKPESLKAFQKSYAIRPLIQIAAPLITVAIEVGEYKEAIRVLSENISEARPNQSTFALMGKLTIVYMLDGQYQQAQELASRLIKQDHSTYAQALYLSVQAIKDEDIKLPTDFAGMQNTVQTFLDVVLKNDPISNSLDERNWKVGYESENELQYVREYFLTGESKNDWTEMVTLQILKKASYSPSRLMNVSKDVTLKACPDTMWKKLKVKGSKMRAVQVEWQTTGKCSKLQEQYETAKVAQLMKGKLARIAYVIRNTEADKNHKSEWKQIIANVPLEHLLD